MGRDREEEEGTGRWGMAELGNTVTTIMCSVCCRWWVRQKGTNAVCGKECVVCVCGVCLLEPAFFIFFFWNCKYKANDR